MTAAGNPLWGSTITLAPAFYESIVSAPVPVDTRALGALSGSPLKLDLLVWLSHRLGYVRRTQLVPWAALSEQFGSDYARLRDFKAVILKQLRDVLAVYPGANVTVAANGLLLAPSRTAIPRSGKSRGTDTATLE